MFCVRRNTYFVVLTTPAGIPLRGWISLGLLSGRFCLVLTSTEIGQTNEGAAVLCHTPLKAAVGRTFAHLRLTAFGVQRCLWQVNRIWARVKCNLCTPVLCSRIPASFHIGNRAALRASPSLPDCVHLSIEPLSSLNHKQFPKSIPSRNHNQIWLPRMVPLTPSTGTSLSLVFSRNKQIARLSSR
jgi:hypothetical protein